jgi:poly-gamma-glutamate synthesis protein (capsule biosynthesis protein)
MWDYGESAFFETLKNLERAGVTYAGAGRSYRKTYSPVFLDHKGFRIAFLAVTDVWNQGSLARHPAKFHIAAADMDGLAATVRRLRADPKVDAVLVSYHGGGEYIERPLNSTRALARFVIDSGADAFLGHHPHVIQGIEVRQGKPIFYSLGNFIMNMNPEHPETELGMLARVRLRRGALPSFEVCPIQSGGLSAHLLHGSPSRDAIMDAWNERLRRVSAHLSHAPEMGALGADGCAPLVPKAGTSRAAASRSGTVRQR